jgi:hypothetical protein
LPEKENASDSEYLLLRREGEGMRTQGCREKIHKAAELCGLSPETVAEIDRVAGFVKENPQICGLTTDAVKPLMAIPDPEKQKEAISHVEKALNRKTPTGGTYKKKLTKPEVEKIVEKVLPSEKPKTEPRVISLTLPDEKKKPAQEIPEGWVKLDELEDMHEADIKEKYPKLYKKLLKTAKYGKDSGNYQPGDLKVTDTPPMAPLSVTKAQELKEVLAATVPAAPPRPPTPSPMVSTDPDKQKRADMEYYAGKLFDLMPSGIQLIITDIMRERPSHKVKDIFYLGIQALGNQKNPVRP